MAHAIQLPSCAHESIDAGRIAANTGTLLINGALLLLLLVPLSQRVMESSAKSDDAITIVQVRNIDPVDPLPPERVEIARRPTAPTTRASPARTRAAAPIR